MLPLVDPSHVFVIIAAYNEHSTIETVVNDLMSEGYNVIVVDDGSTNALFQLSLPKKIFFLRHEVNLGQGAALQTGIDFALEQNANFIVTFDADGQHNPQDIKKLMETLEADKFDIVLGSRFIKGSNQSVPLTRRFILQLARYINYLFTGLLLTDAHNGLRAFTNNAAQKIQLTENRMAHASEILSQIRKHNFTYKEVPVDISYTPYSMKKGQTAWSSFRILFDLLLNKIFR